MDSERGKANGFVKSLPIFGREVGYLTEQGRPVPTMTLAVIQEKACFVNCLLIEDWGRPHMLQYRFCLLGYR